MYICIYIYTYIYHLFAARAIRCKGSGGFERESRNSEAGAFGSGSMCASVLKMYLQKSSR